MAKYKRKAASSQSDEGYLTQLCQYTLRVIKTTIYDAMARAREEPDVAFSEVQTQGKLSKRAMRIDLAAEDNFGRSLHKVNRGQFENIKVFGEERRTSLATAGSVVALVDAIDGSDLFERGLSNWCSAILYFDPSKTPGERILASFVAIPEPSLRIYYARSDGDFAWVTRSNSSRQVAGPSGVKKLSVASLCFYGQKANRLCAASDTPLIRKMATIDSSFRIYNLGGNPMLVRLVDSGAATARGIDAVVELGAGQKAHDFVAGVYIAKKGGAHIVNLDRSEFTYEQMEETLLQPGKRFTYVAASSPELVEQILQPLLT
jgi:fructose-1,6-bisphosphatase/inositol monophosphatase family enzyme